MADTGKTRRARSNTNTGKADCKYKKELKKGVKKVIRERRRGKKKRGRKGGEGRGDEGKETKRDASLDSWEQNRCGEGVLKAGEDREEGNTKKNDA